MTAHVVAGAVVIGTWSRLSIGWLWLPAAMVAVRWRRPVLVVVAVVLAAGWWSDRALDRFDPPPAGPVEGWVTLTSDPRPSGPVGVRAGATWGTHRVSITAHGPLAGRLDDSLAGERVWIVGSFRPVRADDDWARWRHEVGSVTVDEIRSHSTGSPLSRATNAVRRLLAEGAASLERDDRAVFSGMVLGDDREQSATVADDFRAAGLGHLLVVSGQNVAFVLALLGPLTRRLRPAGRVAVVLFALVGFVTLTRFEASVLRASVMAGVSVGAAVLGGPVDGRRALSMSVAGLLVLDPFLVRVVAFQLSVLATGGIVWLSGPLAGRLRGPELVRVAAATTISAQLAVAPLLVLVFGPVPLASLPANLLAGPVSGPIMMWGWTGGLVAGIAGEPVAGWLHLPTALLVGWVRGVASVTASGPFVTVGGVGVVLLGAATACLLAPRGAQRRFGAAVAVGVVAVAVRASPALEPGSVAIGAGLVVHNHGSVVVELDDPHRPRDVLEALRHAGVRRIDLIVATDGDRADAEAVIAIRTRFGDVEIAAPPLHRVPDGHAVHPGTVLQAGVVSVVPASDGTDHTLVVRVCPTAPCQDEPP
ncbi:MAG: ComEC/Rec2 family competence protein [Actinomycetota bacterium]